MDTEKRYFFDPGNQSSKQGVQKQNKPYTPHSERKQSELLRQVFFEHRAL